MKTLSRKFVIPESNRTAVCRNMRFDIRDLMPSVNKLKKIPDTKTHKASKDAIRLSFGMTKGFLKEQSYNSRKVSIAYA